MKAENTPKEGAEATKDSGVNSNLKGPAEAGRALGREEKTWFQRMAQRLGPLAVGIALAAGCGSVVWDNEEDDAAADADSDAELDSETDAQTETEDAAIPDVEDIQDLTDELEEDAGPDVDADGVAEVEDAPDVTDEVEFTEDDGAVDEGTGCVVDEHDEVVDRLSGPEPLNGLTQTLETVEHVTTRTGDCETTETTRQVVAKNLGLSGVLDTSALASARGVDTNALNGQMIIVGLETDRIELARKIDENSSASVGGSIGGMPGEYSFIIRSLRADHAVVEGFDLSGSSIGTMLVYLTGTAPVPGLSNRALIAYNLSTLPPRVGLALIEIPTTAMEHGSAYPWTAGDGANFAFGMSVTGTEMRGWGWTRVP